MSEWYKCRLARSNKDYPSTPLNPFNIRFVARFDIITLTYAKLINNTKNLISPSHRHEPTHTNTLIVLSDD